MRNRRCVLCGPIKEKEISCFSFPKDEKLKLAWLNFCGMKVEHVRPSHRLCVNHFLPSDIIDRRDRNQSVILRYQVVPTVRYRKKREKLQKKKDASIPQENKVDGQKCENPEEATQATTVIDISKLRMIKATEAEAGATKAPMTETTDMKASATETSTIKATVTNAGAIEATTIKATQTEASAAEATTINATQTGHSAVEASCTECSTIESKTTENSTSEEGVPEAVTVKCDTPEAYTLSDEWRFTVIKPRRVFSPRYIGDISLQDVQTPKRALRTISFVKQKFVEQKKKMKLLENKNWKMSMKLEALKDLLDHLKGRKLIEQEAINNILVFLKI